MKDHERLDGRHYPLYLAGRAVMLHLPDRGVWLAEDGLRFAQGSRSAFRRYEDIVAVNLTMVSVPKLWDWARTTIRFRDGYKIAVTNTNGWGLAGPTNLALYREFNAALHARLLEAGTAPGIAFSVGPDPRFTAWINAVCLASLGFFVALPAWMLLQTGESKAGILLLCGLVYGYCIARTALRNRPRLYSPYEPPDLTA